MEDLVYSTGRGAAITTLTLLMHKNRIVKLLCRDYNSCIKKLKKEGLVKRDFIPKSLKRNLFGLIPKESQELYYRVFFELLSLTSFMTIIDINRYFESKETDNDRAHELVDSFSLGYFEVMKELLESIELLNVIEIKQVTPETTTFGLGTEKLDLRKRMMEYWNCWVTSNSDAERIENVLRHFVMCFVNVFEDVRVWVFLSGLSSYSTICMKTAKNLAKDSINAVYGTDPS